MKKNNRNNLKPVNYIRATGIIRNSHLTIDPSIVDKRVSIYNGRIYQTFMVKREMVGHKLGEFIFTKVLGPKIHAAIALRKQKKAAANKKKK